MEPDTNVYLCELIQQNAQQNAIMCVWNLNKYIAITFSSTHSQSNADIFHSAVIPYIGNVEALIFVTEKSIHRKRENRLFLCHKAVLISVPHPDTSLNHKTTGNGPVHYML